MEVPSEELISAQYRGAKEVLRPIYDALVHVAKRIDPKLRIEAAPGFVRFARRQPFAVVKPVGTDRVELGLSLPGIEPSPTLKACRGLAGEKYVTHKRELIHLSQVNAELVLWLKRAHELTGMRAPPRPKPAAEAAPEPADGVDGASEAAPNATDPSLEPPLERPAKSRVRSRVR